jgi:hypothetical protein
MNKISQKEAKALGLRFYFTGKPCKHGHVSERYVAGGHCCECIRLKGQKDRPKNRVNARNWMRRNRTRMKEYKKEYMTDPANRTKHNETCKQYRDSHKAKYNALTRKRQATLLNATPKWLTASDHVEIERIYQNSRDITEETGIQHVVDHIYPLQGETVSGLHVPSNLQVMTHKANASKSNNYPET